MQCKDIINVIEATYPKHAALEWDNVGLLAGRTDKDVHKIFVALDATDDVIERAIKTKADMLITHHPLLFSPIKYITDEHFIGARLLRLIQHDISYYAMHTNYDVLGMAELSGNILGLQDAVPLEITEEEAGIGKVGTLKETLSLRDCCELIKEKFELKNVRVFGNLNDNVQRIAICPGSGKGMAQLAIDKGADVLVTGDISHHEGIDALSKGLAIIDAGHYGLEYIFIDDVASFIEKNIKNIEVEKADICHPFQTI